MALLLKGEKGRGEKRKERKKKGEAKGKKGRGGITIGFSLQKVNVLVTSLLMFSFIDTQIEAVDAYISK